MEKRIQEEIFKIRCSRTEFYTIEIQALNAEQALEKAKDIEMYKWKHASSSDDIHYQNDDMPSVNPTMIISGYDVYFEDTNETIEMFTPILGDAYRIAKRSADETFRPVTINKCNQECFVEQDGTPWGIVDTNSYKKLITIIPKSKNE